MRYFYGVLGAGQYAYDTETGVRTKLDGEQIPLFPPAADNEDPDDPGPSDDDRR